MQDAVGIFVAEHQFSHLPSFKSYGWIPEVGLTLEMEGLIFGDDGDANFVVSEIFASPQPTRLGRGPKE